jgi:hypothetical protein
MRGQRLTRSGHAPACEAGVSAAGSGGDLHGAGLGLRRTLIPQINQLDAGAIDFLEVAPENWIGVGGRLGRQFRALAERYPLVCHGLSLSLGGARAAGYRAAAVDPPVSRRSWCASSPSISATAATTRGISTT